ncbi:MAG: tetratricopeptide repeat protein [Candidatus Eisenbacteria bacterium]|nr:tetratricopeptide repeat protein [Candidatus Eisenbacteria bacterium]
MASKRPDDIPERDELEALKRAMASQSPREAAATAIRLGDVYLASDSYNDALEYFRRVLRGELGEELDDRHAAEVYVRAARCHLGLGEFREAREACARLDDLELDEGTAEVWAEANVVLARIEIESGRYEEALRAAQKAYDSVKSLPDGALLAEAGKALGIANAELGNVGAARDYFTDYLVTQKRLGDEAGLAAAYNNLGVLAKRAGDLNGALDYLESALKIDRRLGRSAAIADRLTNIGIILYKLSRWAEAEERLIEAKELYSRIGAVRGHVAAQAALGNVCRVRREWGRATELFDSALRTSQDRGYLRAEALVLEYAGDLELDRGRPEEALGTLNRALGCAYRLSSNSDVVAEVLRRRAEALFILGRISEAERDCSDGIKLTRELGDKLEEGALLRVLASISYAKGERAAAEVLVARAEEILRRVGDSFELARTSLADGVGLRESASNGDVPLERIEARLSAAEAIFTRVGAGYWVAKCQFERGKALQRGGQTDRARNWLERARLKFEVGHDSHGLAEVDAVLRELDAELADAGVSSKGRYTVIAEGYRFLETGEPSAEDIHRLADEVAEAVSADRLVVFTLEEESGPVVVTSVDSAGQGLADVAKFVRSSIASRGHSRALIVSDVRSSDTPLPRGIGALALIPALVGLARDRVCLVYADRVSADGSAPFTRGDVEFLGAGARLLGLACARVHERREWAADGQLALELGSAPMFSGIITRDAMMIHILEDVERLKESRIPIVIRGESGVGKELVARAIHEGGRSRTGKFVALNAGAIAPHLQESELFGHVKGAFTDADRDREGLVQAASDGTLFLDEVGEMSPQLQVKLLRFLQNGEYRRVGENVIRTSNARVISATNKDLAEEVKQNRFRRDLFYRLCAVVIEVPPLRDRPDDIPLLMEHFLKLYSKREGKSVAGFTREAREIFQRHDWRGNNVRELENEVRRGVALCDDGEYITADKLSAELREGYGPDAGGDAQGRSLREEVEALEKSRILEALGKTGWNKQAAADILGMSRTGLHAKMRKYGIG